MVNAVGFETGLFTCHSGTIQSPASRREFSRMQNDALTSSLRATDREVAFALALHSRRFASLVVGPLYEYGQASAGLMQLKRMKFIDGAAAPSPRSAF